MNNAPRTELEISKNICRFCRAFNIGRCGCAESRKARGEKLPAVVDINSIVLVF